MKNEFFITGQFVAFFFVNFQADFAVLVTQLRRCLNGPQVHSDAVWQQRYSRYQENGNSLPKQLGDPGLEKAIQKVASCGALDDTIFRCLLFFFLKVGICWDSIHLYWYEIYEISYNNQYIF